MFAYWITTAYFERHRQNDEIWIIEKSVVVHNYPCINGIFSIWWVVWNVIKHGHLIDCCLLGCMVMFWSGNWFSFSAIRFEDDLWKTHLRDGGIFNSFSLRKIVSIVIYNHLKLFSSILVFFVWKIMLNNNLGFAFNESSKLLYLWAFDF